jgi:hypothetical protein
MSSGKKGKKQEGKMLEEQHKTQKWAKEKRGLVSGSP